MTRARSKVVSTITTSLMSLFLGAGSSAAIAQAFAPRIVTPLPGATAVGQQSAALTVPVMMTAAGQAAAVSVVTQGVASLDFVAAGGSCAAGATYTAGQSCTVSVVFAPKYPGERFGAAVVLAGDGSVMGSTMLHGTATGALSVIVPGRIDTVAGDGAWIYRGDGVLATATSIFLPTGVVADAAGNLFLSDSNNNRIRRVDAATGLISTVAGSGSPGYSGDGGPATQAMISDPAGIVIDGAGNLYFADTGNHAIRRIDVYSHTISTVAGVPGVQGYTGDNADARMAKLSLPEGVAFDAAQNMYIADTGNNCIRMVSAASGVITTVAGTGTAGYSGDGQTALSARLNSPWSLTVSPGGTLLIADLNNNVIRAVSAAGTISTIAGSGARGFSGDGSSAGSAAFNAPASVVLDPAGNLYIADSGNNRVRKISSSTGIIQTLSGINSEQFSGDAGPANLASMYGPYALHVDQAGNLFIADIFHHRIRRISAETIALTYDTIRVSKISPPQIEGLENDGNGTMTIAPFTFNNTALDAATTTCTSGGTLTVDATCNLGVEFAPTVVGDPVLGSLSINSNAANTADVISVSGTVLSVEPTSVSITSSANPSLVGASVTFSATVASASAAYTGNIVFYDGNNVICTKVMSAQYTASCATTSLTLGSHAITAAYTGDAQDASSVSPSMTQVVRQQATLMLAATPNPSVVTAAVTLTATAAAPTGTPTGPITFYDGSTAIGTANLANGVASITTSQLSAATHNLTAQYAGDASNADVLSNTLSEVVQLATSVTTLSSSSATAYVGTSLTFTATVVSTNGPAPTGSVQFMDGSTVVGSGSLNGSGVASLTLSTLAPGSHAISARYTGDTDNATSLSTALAETVQQLPTTSVLTSNINPAAAGTVVQLTATIAIGGSVSPDGAITGTVTFTDGSTVLGTAPVGTNGQAMLSTSTLSAASHSIVASYAGNTNYAANTSPSLAVQVQTTATTTTLTASAANILAGKPVTLTVIVASPTTGIATGTVTIHDGAVSIGQVTLNAQGTATFSTSSLTVGTHPLTASYAGDMNYQPSASTSTSETVSLATTSLTLAGPAAAVDAGDAVNVSASLSTNGIAPTGTVTLLDGTAVIATQTIASGSSFNFSTTALSLGTHMLTASYSGDADNAATTSVALTVVIQRAVTSTTLTTSANPSTLNQSLTLSSSVTTDSPGLSGSVSFIDGSMLLGSVPLVNGTATFNTSTLSFGSHTLTAVFSGDTNHTASTSAAILQQIVQAASAALGSGNNPSVSGTNVIFTARMAGIGTLLPTGSVTFSEGAAKLATVTLDASSTATFQIANLAVGSHTITVTYTGDANYSAASATLVQTVQSATTQIAVTSSANPATYAVSLAFTASITSDGGIATGSVTFSDGGATLGTALLDASGRATLATSALTPGIHGIVVNYAGDGKASASISTPLSITVKQLTSVAIASNSNPAQTLAPIVFTATVSNGGVGYASGELTFTDGSAQLGVVAADATGHASLTLPSMSAGNHAISASYVGDATDFASVSASLTQGVQLRATATSLTGSQTSSTDPQQVTLIAVVHSTGTTPPTGTVNFTTASGAVGSTQVDATGVAALTIELQNAKEDVNAAYSGDAAYAASTSQVTTVSAGVATQFTLIVSPPNETVVSKQRVVLNLTLASVKDFSDTIQLGCLGLPYAATCTFSSPQMKLAANGTSVVQLTVDTGDPLGAGAQASLRTHAPSGTLFCFLPGGLMAGMLLLGRRRRLLPLVMLLLAISVTFGLSGCSGLTMNGTPAGTYDIKITASGQGTGATSSQTLTLTVTQ